MILRYLAVFATAAIGALAQDVRGQVSANNETTPQTRECDDDRCYTVHYVDAGKANHNFNPNSIVADAGDIVSFKFYPTNHSVIKSAYGYPCVPYEYMGLEGEGFFSGFFPVATILDDPPVWNLTINNTDPTFFYCGAPGSCNGWGMVGVINANASTSITNQISLARKADYMIVPGESFPSEAELLSMSKLAQATTATETLTTSPTARSSSSAVPHSSHDDDDDSGLSDGAIAGIAVAAGVVGIGGCALFFLLRRTHSLKKQLAKQESQQPPPMAGGPHPHPHQSFYDSSRHTSFLPPYSTQPGHDVVKTPEGGEYLALDRAGSPPLQQQQGGFVPLNHHHHPRMTTFPTTSELSGNGPPVVELHATDVPSPPASPPQSGSRFSEGSAK